MAEAINSAANGPRAALSKRGNMVQLDLLKAFESEEKDVSLDHPIGP
jgi:hypothetical protein